MTTPWVASSDLAKAVFAAGFEYDPGQDIICSRMNARQRELGYTWAYDVASPSLQMIIDCEPFYFDCGGKIWMIELWKGQYGLETGAEIGVYRFVDHRAQLQREAAAQRAGSHPAPAVAGSTTAQRAPGTVRSHPASGPHVRDVRAAPAAFENRSRFYACAGPGELLEMSFTLFRHDTELFRRGPARHWWLTGFRWGVFSPRTCDLRMEVTITFPDGAMRDAFEQALEQKRYTPIEKGARGISFSFRQPWTLQPETRVTLEGPMQARNKHLVDRYLLLKQALNLKNNDPNAFDAWDASTHKLARELSAQVGKLPGQASAIARKLQGGAAAARESAAAAATRLRSAAAAAARKLEDEFSAESTSAYGEIAAFFAHQQWHSTHRQHSLS